MPTKRDKRSKSKRDIDRELYELVYEDEQLSWVGDNLAQMNQVLTFIRFGDVEGIKTTLSTIPKEFRASFGKQELRHFKNTNNSLFVLMGLTAIESGVPAALSIRMIESFIQKTEVAETIDQVVHWADQAKLDFCRQVESARMPQTDEPDIRRVVRYIHDNSSKVITRAELAEVAGISEEHLSRKFHAVTGEKLTEYIQEVKIRHAMQLLSNTDESLSEIAGYLSFSSQSYFQRVFKRVTGMTPVSYRKQVREGLRLV